MGSASWNVLTKLDPFTIIMVIFGCLFVVREVGKLVQDLFSMFGLQTKKSVIDQQEHNDIAQLKTDVGELRKEINDIRDNESGCMFKKQSLEKLTKQNENVETGIMELLGIRIDDSFTRYMRLGYVPVEEYDNFANVFSAYKKLGGNHGRDAEYARCMKLKVYDATPHSDITREEAVTPDKEN